ncbi:MAG: tetratricopeptide repeat protein [Candidatus Dormibacteria bacterium]
MTTALPSGTVTLLFTDIEGSTRLLDQVGADAWATGLADHHRIMREAMAAHGGIEVHTQGDAFFVAFEDAGAALAAALDAQRLLGAHSWPEGAEVRVRMGVHTGDVVLGGDDYVGMSVHRAARIATAAHGGQIVCSATTIDALQDLPIGASLRRLGGYRLKDLNAPVELFQLCHAELKSAFPEPRSLDSVPHNLPVQISSFVGRERELERIGELLASARLVTLLGPGGTGKTRLAYQAAAAAAESFPDGVWVAELASLSDPALVPTPLLGALGLREEVGRTLTETVVAHLCYRRALVVLDNCEHVVDEAAALALAIGEGCPKVSILVTSREPLRLLGEAAYAVPGLELPEPSESDAVRLFLTRASEARSDLSVSASSLQTVAAICARLDGLPLAIELAAARVRSMSPEEILDRLGRSLDLLTKGRRGAQSRQASLRGAIEWSHQLLGPTEQVMFRRLAIFAGGWTLEAAEHVCPGGSLNRDVILDTLDALVDKSLVVAGPDNLGQTRYKLLETIRDYAAERLMERGEADVISERHAAWCLALSKFPEQAPPGSQQEALWFDALEPDHANLLAALEHLHRSGDLREMELAADVGRFWYARTRFRTAREHLTRALASHPGPSAHRGRVATGLGYVGMRTGDYPQARAYFKEALGIAQALRDREAECAAVGGLGHIELQMGNYPQARDRYREALAIAREIGNLYQEEAWVGNVGQALSGLGEYAQAQACLEEARAMARERNARSSEGLWLACLADLAADMGNYSEARASYEKALAIARELGRRLWEGPWIGALADVALQLGEYPQAQADFEQALAVAREQSDRDGEGYAILGLGNVALRTGDYPRARALYIEAVDKARNIGAPSLSVKTLEAAAALLGAGAEHSKAIELVAAAATARARGGMQPGRAEAEQVEKIIAEARAHLEPQTHDRTWNTGLALTADDALDLAEQHLRNSPEP